MLHGLSLCFHRWGSFDSLTFIQTEERFHKICGLTNYVNNDLEAVQKVHVEVDVPMPHLHMAAKSSRILIL